MNLDTRAMQVTADLLADMDHRNDPALDAHQVIGALIWRAFHALGFDHGLALSGGDGAGPLLALPGHADTRAHALVADLDTHHRLRQPLTGLSAWQGTREDFDVVIATLPGYDVRLTYQPNIIRRRVDQVTAARVAAQLTRPGGLTALLATHDLMDHPVPDGRRHLADLADLIGAIRLPAGTHRRSTGTDEVADLLLLRRRPVGEARRGPDFEHAPAVYLDGEMVTINTYFDTNIDHVLGTLQYDPTGTPPTNLTVTGPRGFTALADGIDHITDSGHRHGLTMTTRSARSTATSHAVSIDDVRDHRPTVRRLRSAHSARAEHPAPARPPKDLAGPAIEQP